MSVRGWVKGASWEPRGSELVAPAAIGDTVLYVEWAGEFDDDTDDASSVSMLLDLNGNQLAYVAVDDDAETITLAAPLMFAASEDDSVLVVSGGQVMLDYIAHVDLGSGDEAEVVIPFSDRDLWPEDDYDVPVQVLLSDNLERIEEVPGRTPQRDAVFTYYPSISAHKGASSPTVHNEWTTLTGWSIVRADRIEYDPATGIFRVLLDGEYDLRPGVTFESNSTNQRALRMRYYDADGVDVGTSRQVRHPSDGITSLETSQYRGLRAGEGVSFETWQNSGATLEVKGSDALVAPPVTDCAIRWVGPL